ncbi:sigma 54-interacting transcriptional regulator [Pseudomonas sp. 10B1]|uniref:sigma 54-interacting transcriptional regulator n=1 Tax=unclassified Pseudomonas TaxID=196821 RepID=UPI002AB3CCF9|nr:MULTISPECIES: sigma 54-interacting transcriptional regulator [unclassified Pseudomonas]MDY7562599.1 sigma 54-interacting transcriptional regulator [Pseudomonas sp. AB6]MEA9979628.1 sigma 54-interacting transcriptional regulator [Pseudomonas sp. RTS4]MEA9997284.1 sigma 54-interacting transcriptional regulator [Pseudomonas sp. AA4]MEB0087408.1 sigma 54-interacting transcriptional regulator [Pseudomonas sp. RTI1]MEB0128492.1 sigma 54-interacting transcriptional regulator [Pseudomonas sp. CCC1.
MFSGVPEPLRYAHDLLAQFARLSSAMDAATLLGDFVRASVELSACEISQLYLLDATHTSLVLNAEYWQGLLQPRAAASLPTDYDGEQLLQYALCQNKVVSLCNLSASLQETTFLPAGRRPWQSLLCVPLLDQHNAVSGLLVCASREHRELQGFADSLGQFGSFVLGQLRLLQRSRRASEISSTSVSAVPIASGYGLIGKSPAMRETSRLIGKVLNNPYTVLLRGETGTGKEVIARAIHENGPRRSKGFIVQNCAALPDSLLESELFGYRKGAFTGADRDRVGLFDAADGGTLLLDEIGDMPLLLQAKLLRVLQEGEIRPLGSNDTHKIDVRIIAATHRDLAALVAAGRFREDLYYRLAQFPIELPALRDRGGDALDLARHFADQACTFLKREPVSWSDGALDQLCQYAFPGNVRELKALVERAILLCDGDQLLPEHFALRRDLEPSDSSLNLRARLEQIERGLLLDCLRKTGGNQTVAARQLGLARRTLLYRMERLNIRPADVRT